MNQLKKKAQILLSWGNYLKVKCFSYRPEKTDELPKAILAENSLICQGMGRSYGDCALNSNAVILSQRLDKFLSFDKKRGILAIQSGVTLEQILNVIIPHGWFLPVIPGTKYVSIGGAIAADIHGKNHYKEGSLINHILSFKLILANGKSINCSKTENYDIFLATFGGMGMSGAISQAVLQLKPIKSISLKSHRRKISNIKEMIEEFRLAKDKYDYMVGWIDHFAKGKNIGRGIFEKAQHISVKEGGKKLSEYVAPKDGITIPKFFPGFLLNKYSMALYNMKRFFGISHNWQENIVGFDEFFHPLDSLKCWNRLYGKKGFFQYQLVIPDHKNVDQDLEKILSLIQQRGCFSFLAVIKYHGPHQGLLSFPIQGFSLALDFPNNKKSRLIQAELNDIVCQFKGRVYLAKDALLSDKIFAKMYDKFLPKWRKIIKKIDKENKFNSLMSERLKLKK